MRILHVLPSYFPAVRYGGPIYSVHALARALKRRGHEVQVYTTNVDGDLISPVPLQRPVDVDGVEVWYFPTELGRRIYRSPTMGRALRNNLAGFDILHTQSVFLWPTSAAAHSARQCGVPYILTPHGMLVPDLIRRKSSLVKRLWIALFERRNIENAAAIQFTSQVEADEFKAFGFRIQDSVIVPNGIDIPPADANSFSTTVQPDIDRPYILYLGRISWKKRLDDLIRAIAQVQDVDLVIAGNDDEGLRPELDELTRHCGVSDRVHFIGYVEGSRKWNLFRGARLFILPSQSENFGIAVLEAMSVGCPVIVSSEVGLSSSVRKTGAGLVIQANPNAIANAINTLMAKADMRQRMGDAGRRAAKELFSWDAIAHQTENLYIRHCTSNRRSFGPQKFGTYRL